MNIYRFGLNRLFAAAAVTAIPFALFGRAGSAGMTISIVVATSLFLLVMITRRDEIAGVLLMLGCATVGGVIGSVLALLVDQPHGQELRWRGCGAILGFAIGSVSSRIIAETNWVSGIGTAARPSANRKEIERP